MRSFYDTVLIHGNGTDKQDNILKGKILAYEEMSQIGEYIKAHKKVN